MSSKVWQRAAAIAALAIGASVAVGPAVGAAAGDAYDPQIDPANFVSKVDNPYFPLVPGARWVYEGKTDAGNERVVTVVTDTTKTILGVETVVVHDKGYVDGKLVEDTYDWFAQDRDGTVWYMGENTHEIKNGKRVSSKGSWEAGVRGAKPGIAMLAHPSPGDSYRQEYFKGRAEDEATVLSTDAVEAVPFGAFKDAVKTKDFSRLEPKLIEHKYYAPGIGLALERTLRGGSGRVGLVEYTAPPAS